MTRFFALAAALLLVATEASTTAPSRIAWGLPRGGASSDLESVKASCIDVASAAVSKMCAVSL